MKTRMFAVFALLVTLTLLPGPALVSAFSLNSAATSGQSAPLANTIRDASVVQTDLVAKARALETYGQLPLSFIPNQGQVDEQVGYYVQSGGQSLWFTADGVTMALPETTLRLEFLDANPSAQLKGGDRLPGFVNYFIGNDPAKWRTNIPTYGRITYCNLWPGVDLTYEGQPGALKSTFTIAPWADPAQIRLAYPAAQSLMVDGQGNLIISATGREVRESVPLAWQEIRGRHVPVTVTYQVVGQNCGFALPEGHDPAYPLVIDPELLYSTFLGGSGGETGHAIAIDGAGNAYVTGYTSSSDFPTTAGAFDTSHNGSTDAFVVKLNASGAGLAYATFLGGSNWDYGYAIAVDGAGSAYVTGGTSSSNFPTTPGAFDTILSGYRDAFVVKLNVTGTGLTYATFLGGNNDECADKCAIAVDGAGSAYVTGDTLSSDFPTTVGAFDTSHNGAKDVFVVKLNAAGTGSAYATFLGGSGFDFGQGIAVNGAGNAYVTGATSSSNFPTTVGALDTSFGGGICSEGPCHDAFVVKMSASGTGLTYATFLGGSNEDGGRAIAVDEVGSTYVTGVTSSSNFPTTPGTFDTSFGGGTCFDGPCEDAFVVKLNAGGTGLIYATFLGGGNRDYSWAIAVDGAGSTYIAGETYSADFPTTVGAFDTTCGTDGNCNPFSPGYSYGDAFVVRVNATGAGLAYATFLGGSRSDMGKALAVKGVGSAFVTGGTSCSDFPVTAGAFDTSYNGGDAFVTKLVVLDPAADEDGDGLLNGWEINGYNGVNLPAMGANPLHKDIFVEIDYMVDEGSCVSDHCVVGHSHKPKPEAINRVVQAFNNAPVSNPDETTGIHLHVDFGPDTVMNPVTGAQWGSLSKSNSLPHDNNLGQKIGNSYDWTELDGLKNSSFDAARRPIFHYVIFAHNLGGMDGTSGISRNDVSSDAAFHQGASDFIVSLGSWDDGIGSEPQQAGTFMHELGHNLGLRHGGDDHANYEPNYLSIMSYAFQTRGLIKNGKDGHLDYSRFSSIPALDENHLNETVGLQEGGAIADYGTRYYCGTSDTVGKRVNNANGAIDWNCNSNSSETDVQANINKSESPEPSYSTLQGYDDWPNLVYTGGNVGPAAQTNEVKIQQITNEELTFEVDSQIFTPYKVAVLGSGYLQLGENISITHTHLFTVANLGENTDTYTITVSSSQGWADVSSVPTTIALSQGISRTIPVTITVPISASGVEIVELRATSQANDNISDSGILEIRLPETNYLPIILKNY